MGAFMEDWRVLVPVYIACSGVWGILAKIAAVRLGHLTSSFVAVTTATTVVAVVAFRDLEWRSGAGILAAAAGGVLGGIASIALYGALRQGPASLVLPLSSLYLVLTVLLSLVFLGESIDLRQVAGIAFGLAALMLLSK